MNRNWAILGVLLIALVIFGCVASQQNTPTVYVCSDGRQVKNASLCSNQAANDSTNQNQANNNSSTGIMNFTNESTPSQFPTCPENLSGILTAPLMDPKYISALTPLGNINPIGHVAPVDHIYFATDYDGKIPLYAPADSWITAVSEGSKQNSSGNYTTTGYSIQYTVCNGLILDFAGPTDITPPLKDELSKQKPDCRYGTVKPGHEGGAEGQCYYSLNYQVKSGEEIGWVQIVNTSHGYDLPFEIWAANYNQKPRSDVNWSYYNDNRYAHAFCMFDMYSGDLKNQFYQKFGAIDKNSGAFVPRTIEPRCGQIVQDIAGTIQGVWFNATPNETEKMEYGAFSLSFIHNNIDPTIGEIAMGGVITEKPSVITFQPTHSGTIDREPSEVKVGDQIYCYNSDNMGWSPGGKILVQMIDDHHLKIEHQDGNCIDNENFVNPFIYQR